MTVSSPLRGKRILITREKNQAKTFSKLVENNGGIPTEIPLIDFKPVKITNELQNKIKKWDTYDWIIFTSKTAFETFINLINEKDTSKWPKIAVIGKKTENFIRSNGYLVHFVPTKYVAEVFIKEFGQCIKPGNKVLIPKGNLARDIIHDSLQNIGAFVEELIIYETYFPLESQKKLSILLKERSIDILTFTSASTVDNFMKIVEQFDLFDKITHCIIACIGPITKNRIEYYGLKVHVLPNKYTVEHMLESIITYLHE